MDRTDLFHGHIGGIDTLARALLVAAEMIESETLSGPLEIRYAGWSGDLGASILAGEETLESPRREWWRVRSTPLRFPETRNCSRIG